MPDVRVPPYRGDIEVHALQAGTVHEEVGEGDYRDVGVADIDL